MNFHQPSFFELDISPEFGHWFAGFVDGEGHFRFYCIEKSNKRKLNLGLIIALRRDDLDVLQYVQRNLQVGKVYLKKVPKSWVRNAKPQAEYICTRTPDLKHIIIPLFEQYPLRSKKARDFEIWKRAVEIRLAIPKGGNQKTPKYLWHKLRQLEFELKAIRQYEHPTEATQ